MLGLGIIGPVNSPFASKAAIFSEDKVVGCGGYVTTVKKGEVLRPGIKTVLSGSDPAVVWESMGASTRAVTSPFSEITEVIKHADLASSIGHKGISRLLAESLLIS
ncbi:hypothetical protein V8G54_029421, partial [Vigna mungo]